MMIQITFCAFAALTILLFIMLLRSQAETRMWMDRWANAEGRHTVAMPFLSPIVHSVPTVPKPEPQSEPSWYVDCYVDGHVAGESLYFTKEADAKREVIKYLLCAREGVKFAEIRYKTFNHFIMVDKRTGLPTTLSRTNSIEKE